VRELQSLLRDRVAAPAATPTRRQYDDVLQQLPAAVAELVPAGSQVLVVTRGDDRLLALDGRTGGHFPQTVDGAYAGHHPLDSAHAIDELERMRAAGWRYLVFPVTALWWLDHYAELRRHLETTGRLLLRSDGLGVVYGLLPPAGADLPSSPSATPSTRSPHEQPRPLRRPPPPVVMAGGAETYALELYEQVRDSAPGWEPLLLAGTGPSGSGRGTPHPGTLIEPVGGDPGQYFFHTDAADYDWFLSSARNKEFYTRYLADFLRAYKPTSCTSSTACSSASTWSARSATCCRRRHRLHAARVPADVLPRRPAAAHRRLAVHRAEPAQVRLLLPRHPAAGLLPARALHQGPARRGRPLPLPQRLPARGVRRLGDPAREAGARAERAAAREAGAARRRPGGAAAQPVRLLRPVHPLQGLDVLLEAMGRLADRGSATLPSWCCTAPTSSTRRRSSRTASTRCSPTTPARCGCTAATGRRTCRR
jgi:hypothetical protein